MIGVDSWISTLDGLVECMMPVCLQTPACITGHMQTNSLFPCTTERIAGRDVPLVLLGDPAYPLLQWLMKAYPNNGRLWREQKTFNY